MSLHALADHMAARGRNSDSMLVHMAPQEVAGLQALALKHGGSLTINPDTGLPEANFLKKLLPMIAGFALGPAGFGLMSAAGAGMTVGAVTGLATGSLSKGLMAGLGAYGGAGLGEAFMGAGTNAMTTAGMANYGDTLAAQGLEAGTAAYGDAASKLALESQKQAMASPFMDRAAAGFGAITKNPAAFGNFAKQNAGSLLAATSPLLADQGVETVTKLDNPGYIRNFDYDPMTQTARALNPVRVRDLGYAGGGEIGAPRTVTQMPGTSPYRDSQAAYEYLMGIAPKAPQQDTQTQTQASSAFNPASEGRYAWDSDKKAYTFIPANGVTETTPTPAPALNYEFGGGDSGSGVGGGSGGVGTAGAGVSASDSADFGDTSSSSSDSSSDSGDAGASGGGGGGAADSGGTGDGDGGASGGGGGGAAGGDGEANGGLMRLHKKFAEGGAASVRDGSSQAAYNYLMGLTNSTRPDAPAYTPQPISIPQPATPTTSVAPTTPTTPIIPTTPTTRGITTLPTTTPTEPTGGITTLPTAPATPVTPVAPVAPTTPTTTTQVDDFVPSIRTKPIVSTITDDVYRETIPRIIPERELDLPEIPAVPDRTGIVDMQPATPGVLPAEEVGPRRGGGGDLPEEFDQYIKPETVATPDGGATVTMPAETAVTQPDGSATVNMPEVVEKVVNAPVVQDTPDGGATVTLPESPYVPADVADTFDPDTGSYVEVGNAGGDFGDRGFEQSDDFGKYGLGVSDFGGGGGGGGKYFDDLSSQMFAANGGLMAAHYAMGGGLGSLGGYSDGGRLLKGPGDGVSDSIPAMIGNKQPARLADGEFVVPARIVSELGNGSTEAGARKLYKMMDRIQAARGKTVGKGRVAKNSRAEKHLPA